MNSDPYLYTHINSKAKINEVSYCEYCYTLFKIILYKLHGSAKNFATKRIRSYRKKCLFVDRKSYDDGFYK